MQLRSDTCPPLRSGGRGQLRFEHEQDAQYVGLRYREAGASPVKRSIVTA